MSVNHQIKADPLLFNHSCLVCKMMTGQTSLHAFENCPLLCHSDLLCQNFINFSQMYKQAQNALVAKAKANKTVNLVYTETEETQMIVGDTFPVDMSSDNRENKTDFM